MAERNQLRAQVRQAAAQIRVVENATSSTHPLELVKLCQKDMERLAQLRSQVELEQQQQLIQLHTANDELEETKSRLKSAETRNATSEEQLAERAETVVRLGNKVKSLQAHVKRITEEAAENLQQQLKAQHDRLFAEAEADKDEVCNRLVSELQRDKTTALEALREELETAAENKIKTLLSEQHHDLVAQFTEEKAKEMHDLQRDLESREARNLEALQNDLTAEHQQVVRFFFLHAPHSPGLSLCRPH